MDIQVLNFVYLIIIIMSIFIIAFAIGFIKNIFYKNKNWEQNYCKDCKHFGTINCKGDGFNCWRKK